MAPGNDDILADVVANPEGFESDSPEWANYAEISSKVNSAYGTIDELQQQSKQADDVIAPVIDPLADPVAPTDTPTDPDTFEPPVDPTNWEEKAKKDFEKYFGWFGEPVDSIKTQDDFQLASDRMSVFNEFLNRDQPVSILHQRVNQDDKEFLLTELENRYSLESEDEIQARFAKFITETGELNERGVTSVKSLKTEVQKSLTDRIDVLRNAAKDEATARQKYRNNIASYIPEYTPVPVSVNVSGNKVDIPVVSLNKQERYKLQDFISSGKYIDSSVGQMVQGENGHKVRVENAFWLNPELRGSYLEKLVKQAYEQGISDYASKNIIK